MRTIFAEYNPQRNSIDIYTSAGYMLRIDCWEAEKDLKTTPGSDCALTSLAVDEPLEYARLYLDGNLQLWVDVEDSFLHGTGYPKAVNVEITVCLNRHPCVFRRNVFDKAFAAFLTAIENKSIIKALPQPFLFCGALLAGHGAADMFLVNIFFCDPNIVHRLFLQCRNISRLNCGNAAFDFFIVPIPPAQSCWQYQTSEPIK